MSLPGFTAEASLYQAETTYRSDGAGAAAARQSVQAAVIGGGGRETSCKDCDGNLFPCPPGTGCVRLCTRTGGYAYCKPNWW